MINNIKVNSAIRDLLTKYEVFPKIPGDKFDIRKIQRIAFADNLHVSEKSLHWVRDENVMVIGSLGYMSYAHSPVHGFSAGAFCSIAVEVSMMGPDRHCCRSRFRDELPPFPDSLRRRVRSQLGRGR